MNRRTAAGSLGMGLAALLACERSSAPSTPSTTASPAPVTTAPSPSPSPQTSPTPSPGIQGGSFRLSPDVGPDGMITIPRGDRMVVNATDVAAANPTLTLHLQVSWGDGDGQRVGCGPCRLDHVYQSQGRSTLEATVDDGQAAGPLHAAASVTRTAVVNVVAPDPGPAPGPNPSAPPPASCTYPIPAPVWVTPADGRTVSGTVTLECALPPGYPAACVQFMDFLGSVPNVRGCFGRSSSGPRFAVSWDTHSCPNGTVEIECAGGPQSAYANVIHVEVRN